MRRCLLLSLLSLPAMAQDGPDASLVALVQRLAVDGAYVPRTFRGPGGVVWASTLAGAFQVAGRETGETPALLAAVACNESGFRPDALGAHGELGIMQVHPRWPARGCADLPRLRRDVLYQARCGARELRRWRVVCSRVLGRVAGDREVLSAYNTGTCQSVRGLRYAQRVLSRLEKIIP